jgi:Ca2+-binding RTX toxin-like protein
MLIGDTANNILIGGKGNDTLIGNGGKDTFVAINTIQALSYHW